MRRARETPEVPARFPGTSGFIWGPLSVGVDGMQASVNRVGCLSASGDVDEMLVETKEQYFHLSDTNIQIIFSYPTETYEDISNQGKLGLEEFWSGIGGFVGIFLGFSLWQIPSLMSEWFTFLKELQQKFNE